jgi:LysM repeat protein
MFVRLLVIGLAAVVAWAVFANTSGGAGPERVYIVRPTDTLWSIAAASYGGDPREGVWKLERRNHLASATLRPGQRLVLP